MTILFGVIVAAHVAVSAHTVLFPTALLEHVGEIARRESFWIRFLWTFAIVTASTISVFLLLVRKFLPSRTQQPGDYGSAHWATDKEIKASGLFASRGIVIGALRRFGKVRLLRYDGEGHVIVVSPTRSGKGVSVVVPTALTWEHSVLFNDIKGELWALTAGWRRNRLKSICLKFDATCGDGSAARWNPLFEIRPYPYDVRDAQNIALTLTASESPVARSDNERHWRVMGSRLIKAAILHQLYIGQEKTLPSVYKLLTSTNRDIEATLSLMLRAEHDSARQFGWKDPETNRPTATHPAIAHVARDMLSKADRERSSIVSAAVSYLEPFDDPIMALNVSESDFALSDLMNNEKPVSLYLTTPVADLERVQPLHRLFFTLAGTRNTEHLDFENGKPAPNYKHPLLEVFDECAHLGYTPVIQKHFSLASGFGIYGLFVFQDLSQLYELYGRNESITSNCDVKVAFAPNNLETAGYLTRLLGTETREKRGAGKAGIFARNSKHAFQSIGRPLLTPDECARLPRDKSIVIRNGFPPILGDKIPYYQIPELHSRSMIPAPASDRITAITSHWSRNLPIRRESRQGISQNVIKSQIKSSSQISCKKGMVARSSAEQIVLFPIEHLASKESYDRRTDKTKNQK